MGVSFFNLPIDLAGIVGFVFLNFIFTGTRTARSRRDAIRSRLDIAACNLLSASISVVHWIKFGRRVDSEFTSSPVVIFPAFFPDICQQTL
jgi:hypothetical protein